MGHGGVGAKMDSEAHLDFQPVSFGKYLLLQKIGSGGMAEIYRAKAFGPHDFVKEARGGVGTRLAAQNRQCVLKGHGDWLLQRARIDVLLRRRRGADLCDRGGNGGSAVGGLGNASLD